MNNVQLSQDAMRLLRLLSRGDATHSEIALLRFRHQSRVLTLLQTNRLIEWKSRHVCAITAAGEECLQQGGKVR